MKPLNLGRISIIVRHERLRKTNLHSMSDFQYDDISETA